MKDFGYIINNEEEDEEDEDSLSKLEDEVKCAPWHTTKAFLQVAKGRGILQLTGKTTELVVKSIILYEQLFRQCPFDEKLQK